jgi:hypothetical protein
VVSVVTRDSEIVERDSVRSAVVEHEPVTTSPPQGTDAEEARRRHFEQGARQR